MKEIHWRSTGLIVEMLYIKRCSAQALQGTHPMCVVPAGCWQAARPLGEYSFLGCTVAPGFEFQDFEMLSGGSAALAHITSLRVELAELV